MKELSLREQQLLQLTILKEIHRVCKDNDIRYFMMYGTLLGAVRHKGFIPWDDDIDIAMLRDDYNRFVDVCMKGALKNRYVIQNDKSDPYFEFTISRIGMKGTYSNDPSRTHIKSMNYTYVDVFPYDNVPDESAERDKHSKSIYYIQRVLHFRMNYKYKKNNKAKLFFKSALSAPFKLIPLRVYMNKYEYLVQKYNDSETKDCAVLGGRYPYCKEIIPRDQLNDLVLITFEDMEFWAPRSYDSILSNLYGDYMKLPPESERVVRHHVFLLDN